MLANFSDWMPVRDQLVLFSFVGAVGLIATATGGMAVRRAYLAVQRKPSRPKRRWLRWTERVVIALAVFGLACGAYGWLVEPYWLDQTVAQVPTAKLPPGAAAIRIVHISDLHCDPKQRLEDDLPTVIAELKPDLICFTGDAANSPDAMENFRRCMTALAKIAPTYAVWGNWEGHFADKDYYGGTGVKVLHDASERIVINGQPLTVVGVRYQQDHRPGLRRALRDVATDDPVVLLCHIPSVILELPGRGVDLCLSGHIHGGQIALPLYGAMVTLTPTGKRFEQGLYKHEDTYLYVSRGVGMEGAQTPRVRFFARPEVTLIELVPARSAE